MKNLFALGLLWSVTITLGYAQQAVNVTGSVKDDKGNVIPYAFVRNRPYNNAAYADSLGNFKLEVMPNTALEVKSNGYLEAHLNTGTNTDFSNCAAISRQRCRGQLKCFGNESNCLYSA